MDCSIEIIGEVIPEKSSKEDKQENEFEVVYDASASKKVIQVCVVYFMFKAKSIFFVYCKIY